MLEWRLKAYRHWARLLQSDAQPRWANPTFPPVNFQRIVYYSAPQAQAGAEQPGRGGPRGPAHLREAGHPGGWEGKGGALPGATGARPRPACHRGRVGEDSVSRAEIAGLEARVVEAIQTCYDPEIPVNIYELGLIYDVSVTPGGGVRIRMTLTSPNCPSAAELPGEIARKVRSLAGVSDALVEVVFDPPWDPSRMSEAARFQLGLP